MKPGIQSTEFWMTMVANLIAGYATWYGTTHGQDTRTYIIWIAIVNAIYALSRAIVKAYEGKKGGTY